MQFSILAIGATLFVLSVIYFSIFHPWQLSLGSTNEELQQAIHWDNIVDKPSFNATCAKTINTIPEIINNWIVYMEDINKIRYM